MLRSFRFKCEAPDGNSLDTTLVFTETPDRKRVAVWVECGDERLGVELTPTSLDHIHEITRTSRYGESEGLRRPPLRKPLRCSNDRCGEESPDEPEVKFCSGCGSNLRRDPEARCVDCQGAPSNEPYVMPLCKACEVSRQERGVALPELVF